MYKYNVPKVVYFIFIGKIFMELGNYLWPLFTFLGDTYFGFSATVIASYLTLFTILALLGTILGGKLTDTIGRKKTFTIFMVLSGVICVSAGLLSGTVVIVLLTVNAFVIAIGGSATTAMITDLTPIDQRKDAFALYYIAMNFGFAFGPLLGGFLYDLGLLRWLFIGDGLTTLIFAGIVLFFVPESLPSKEDRVKVEGTLEEAKQGSIWNVLFNNKPLLIFLFVNIMLFVVFRQFTFGIPMYAKELYARPGTIFGIVMTVNAGMVVILTTPILKLTDKVATETKIMIGGVCYLVGFGSLAFISNVYLFIAAAMVWTIGEIFIAPTSKLYIANHSPITHRGRFNSIFDIVRKLGSIMGFYIAGYLIQVYGFDIMWLGMALISLLGIILMYSNRRYQNA